MDTVAFKELEVGDTFAFFFEIKSHEASIKDVERDRFTQQRHNELWPYIFSFRKTGENTYIEHEVIQQNAKKPYSGRRVYGCAHRNTEVLRVR